MLINTVIIFLKDLLPIFILICLVSTYFNPPSMSFQVKTVTVLASTMGVVISFYFLPNMGELFSGVGIEVIKSIAILIVYFALLLSSTISVAHNNANTYQQYLVAFAVVIFVMINATEFIVFLQSYLVATQSIRDVLAGLSIGFGICLSFSALLYFLLVWFIEKNLFTLVYCLMAFFLSGQLSQTISLLQQVDIIQSSNAVWDTSRFVKDSSEYGHLLNTLFGYEASPSLEFIILYAASLLVFLICFFIKASQKPMHYKWLQGGLK